ncbi:MAG: T9SS type A sorting domain-containing protein [Flavobacteriaceae bacterium]|nr:T9SS type A sorting domain-containing protein [Flavobacteriaceae bacterium]
MKMKNLFAMATLLFTCGLFAQEKFPPTTIAQGTFMFKTAPLRDMPNTPALDGSETKTLKIVPNNLRRNEQVNMDSYPLGNDLLIQSEVGNLNPMPLEVNIVGSTPTGFTPPDPTGAAGPNHYVHAVNSSVIIYDKSGTLVTGPTPLGTFLGIPSNSGDPIVLYDQLADRWVVSEFGSLSNSLAIGVSETNDPTGAYNVYQYSLDAFPDYPHYAIWHDGYYVTANKGGANKVYTMERDVMLAGGANPQIIGYPLPGMVQNTNTVLSPEPANLTGTNYPAGAPGLITYLQDDGWGGIANDHLKVWEIENDWVTPGNSTISAPDEIATTPFNSVFAPFGQGDVNQPGTGNKIDMIGGIISYAANFRSFGTHNSWLITFNTDIDGNDTSGVRWIELRNTGTGPFTIYQEGTYAPADGHSRFMGSAAMDAAGNIGMGFNIASATLKASIKYTGRYDGDPLGQMTIAEEWIHEGTGVQTNTNRFGDYSHLTMDPNNFTFWHTAEYFETNNSWRTRVASFSLSGGFAKDVGVNNITTPNSGILTATETVEVTVRNFGLNTQSNIPLELRVDGSLITTETFTGSVAPNETETYTFTQTVDLSTSGQTYEIEVKSVLSGDEFTGNDGYTKEVTHLLANDVGVIDITAPESGEVLGNQVVTVTVKNFGASTQTGFNMEYSIDGGTPEVEAFTGSIDSEEEVSFSFAQEGDFSAFGSYDLTSKTSLGPDQDNTNDEFATTVTNSNCNPTMDCSFGDGFTLFSVAEINNASGCEGYADFTDLIANLAPGSTNSLTLTTGYGDQYVTVWIDFNDDFDFTVDEKVVTDFIIAPGEAAGSYTETVDLVIPAGATIGEHRMRAKSNWQAPVPDDACEETQYGETEDYTANIGELGIVESNIANADLIVTTLPNNQFEASLITSFDGIAYIAIYNTLGQQLGFKPIAKNGDRYSYNIDMSATASGVYLIKMGAQESGAYKSAKIIVK